MKFYNKVNLAKASLAVHVWFPRNYLKFTGTVLESAFYKDQAVNKKINFMRLKFWRHGHIALLMNDGKQKHYISWYPMHDIKRQATGHFASPQRDLAIWGAPNVTLHTQATKQTIQAAFAPLFMHYKKSTGPDTDLRTMPMDELRIDTEKSEFFPNNISSIFSLYRPFSHLYFSSLSKEECHCVLQEHIQDFNFSKLAFPYESGHELNLFLMHSAGLPVNQIPGCYDGEIDLKILSQHLEEYYGSMEITTPIGAQFF